MKRKLLAFIVVCFFTGISFSYSQGERTSTVYFIRSTGFSGSATSFKAFIDDNFVCNLNNKRYSIHEIEPGEHKFTVQFAGKKSKKKAEPIMIEMEAGKTYYVQMIFQTGLIKNNLYCQEVTKSSADAMIKDLKEDTKCK